MFQSARIKLTAWYLLIIMVVSAMFSVAFYEVSTQEIEHVMRRIEFMQDQHDKYNLPPPPNAIATLEHIKDVKERLQLSLILVNGFILLIAGGAGYFLAGRTLRPIQEMVDDQNQFISDASHELRTPIAVLRAEMEASLLEKKLSDSQARTLIGSNLEELGKLQELANNLLELARVRKKGVASQERVSLKNVLQTAQKKVNAMAKKKKITITLTKIDGTIRGDKASLTEVFVNLFDNAIKYSPEGSAITVSTKIKSNAVMVIVQDTGMGIAKKDLPHIFDRFYRADKSRSQASGHGLGLSITKKIVEAHNGSIAVKSVVDKGTTFYLTIPRIA